MTRRRRSHSAQAFVYVLAITLVLLQALAVQAAVMDDITPTGTSDLVARADRTRTATRTQYVCHWPDVIEGTKTTPMVLVIGLSIGSVAGIVVSTACETAGPC